MQITKRHITKRSTLVSLLLLFLLTAYISNRAIYYHGHKLSNGKVMNHAHPYSKTSDSVPLNNHNHSDSEFALLKQMEVLVNFIFILVAVLLSSKTFHFSEEFLNKYFLRVFHFRLGRAPPCK